MRAAQGAEAGNVIRKIEVAGLGKPDIRLRLIDREQTTRRTQELDARLRDLDIHRRGELLPDGGGRER